MTGLAIGQHGVAVSQGYQIKFPTRLLYDDNIRRFQAAFETLVMSGVEEAQWRLGAEITQDGIDCNIGNAAGCKIYTLVKNKPMVQVKATDADRAKLREALTATVLPGWVKRCGARCGEIYNQAIAPISGVKYAP